MNVMKKVKSSFFGSMGVLIIILLLVNGCYQLDEVDRDNPNPHREAYEGIPLDEETISQIEGVLERATSKPFLPGVHTNPENSLMPPIPGVVVGIRIPGKQAWFGASGYSDLERKIPMNVDDKFRAGSITKSFVASSILKLSEEMREFDVDDKLEEWLPGIIPNGNEISIRNLLMHSSCLNNYTSHQDFSDGIQANPARRWTREEFIAMTIDAGPVCSSDSIGKNFNYSNTNYLLLGLILEQEKDKPLGDILFEEFFSPLGLRNTFFQTAGDGFPGDYTSGYFDLDGNFVLELVPYVDPSALWAAGAVFTDAKDLLAWTKAAFSANGRALSATLQSQRLNSLYEGVLNAGSQSTLANAGMGIGMGVIKRGEMLGHVGEIYGFSAYAGVYAEKQVSIVVLTNRTRYHKEENKEMDVFTIIDQIFMKLYPEDYDIAEIGKYEGYDEQHSE
ncbi:MAG: beta-lactamase family protein [SAR324 cluster bacterium]|nr:beta-lactamase family protein [SAR324 cluster bacterium]